MQQIVQAMIIRRGGWIGVLLLLGALLPMAARAQERWQFVEINTVAVEQESAVGLQVFFALRDAEGNAVTRERANLAGEAQLVLNSRPELGVVTATIEEPKTPIDIALLIDTSGSMASALPSVLAAAQKAVDTAPPGTRFTVYRFSSEKLETPFNPLIERSSDPNATKQAIGGISQPKGATCLFNASYRAVDYLQKAAPAPESRRAVILFTDGRDEEQDGGPPCSSYNVQSVSAFARTNRTPIHTIGLCASADCGTIDGNALKELARETGGFAATGDQGQIEDRFRAIMDGIKAQWVARALVLPSKNPDNRANLTVTPRDQPPVTGTVAFASSKDYGLPPTIALDAPALDANQANYTVNVQITNPESLRILTIQTVDAKQGILVGTPQRLPMDPAKPQTTIAVTIPTDKLAAESEYCIQVGAIGLNDKPFEAAATNRECSGDARVLAEKKVTFRPDIRLEILKIDPDYVAGVLRVQLKISNGGKAANVRGEILDKDDRQIGLINPLLPSPGGEIAPPLPELLKTVSADYRLRLQLDDAPKIGDEKPFLNRPPVPPSQAPLVALAVVLALAIALAAWLFYRRQQQRPQNLPQPVPIRDPQPAPNPTPNPTPNPAPQPPPATPDNGATLIGPPRGNPTVILPQPKPATVQRARVRIIHSPAAQSQAEQLVTSFPYKIGRAGQLIIAGDKQVSRIHAELTVSGGVLYLTDLDSSHGTFIGEQRLAAQTPTAITERTKVRLGPTTQIEIDPNAAQERP